VHPTGRTTCSDGSSDPALPASPFSCSRLLAAAVTPVAFGAGEGDPILGGVRNPSSNASLELRGEMEIIARKPGASRPLSNTPNRSIPARDVDTDTGSPTRPSATVTHTRLTALPGSIATITWPNGTLSSNPDTERLPPDGIAIVRLYVQGVVTLTLE